MENVSSLPSRILTVSGMKVPTAPSAALAILLTTTSVQKLIVTARASITAEESACSVVAVRRLMVLLADDLQ